MRQKKFKRKKKKLNSVENREVNTNLCYGGRKSFVTWQIKCRRCDVLCPHCGLLKIPFLEYHVMTKKLTMMRKGIITFNPTYLTKVTYISSILKFLNTESLVVQVSNTRFSIQSLHLCT